MQTFNKYGQPIFIQEISLCFCDDENEILNYPIAAGMKRMYLTKDYTKLIIAVSGAAGTPVISEVYTLNKVNKTFPEETGYVTYDKLKEILNKLKEDLINASNESNSNDDQSRTAGDSK